MLSLSAFSKHLDACQYKSIQVDALQSYLKILGLNWIALNFLSNNRKHEKDVATLNPPQISNSTFNSTKTNLNRLKTQKTNSNDWLIVFHLSNQRYWREEIRAQNLSLR